MIDMKQFEWGLRPLPQVDVVAIYGARTIFQNGNIEFLPDRQSCLGEKASREVLCEWINHVALPKLRGHIKKEGWMPSSEKTFQYEDWQFKFEASPCSSYGYIYITAYLMGLDHFPEVDGVKIRWSGDFIPKVGDTVLCTVNKIGRAQVLGFYIESGWVETLVKPENPPKWFITQNGENAVCGAFGMDIARIDDTASNDHTM